MNPNDFFVTATMKVNESQRLVREEEETVSIHPGRRKKRKGLKRPVKETFRMQRKGNLVGMRLQIRYMRRYLQNCNASHCRVPFCLPRRLSVLLLAPPMHAVKVFI